MTTTDSSTIKRTFEAGDDASQMRLDRWLATMMPDVSRSRIQAMIRAGQVTCGRTIWEPRHPVKSGDVYEVILTEAAEARIEREDIPLSVVHEDQHLIVIDKPAGLVVHPGAGNASGTLVNALVAHCGASLSGIGGVKRPGIVHRLDKDTSGLLVVAKGDAAHQHLSEQFKSHGRDGRLKRRYLALVWGVPVPSIGKIEAPLARSTTNRKKIAVAHHRAAREAITHYRVVDAFEGSVDAGYISLVSLELETGRTHQIRVHLAHIGHPVVGDRVYGSGFRTRQAKLSSAARVAVEGLNRQALHAETLGFEHPAGGRQMTFKAPIPEDFQCIVDAVNVGVGSGDHAAKSGKASAHRHRAKASRRKTERTKHAAKSRFVDRS